MSQYFFVASIVFKTSLLFLIVWASPHKIKLNIEVSPALEDELYEKSHLRTEVFDLRGTIRQSFAMNLLSSHISQSFACSPLSALIPLVKLALGAEGNSKEELIQALGMGKSMMKSETKDLIKMLKTMPGVKLKVGSRIFVSEKVKLNKTFVRDTDKIFESSVQKLDFERPKKAQKKVEEWIKKKTKKVVNLNINYSVTGVQSAIIMNIITFIGNWDKPFRHVEIKTFNSPRGVIPIAMMNRQGYYNYYKSDTLKAQIIEIPYKKREASFIVVLPYSKTGLSELITAIKKTPKLLNNALAKMSEEKIILSLPRFQVYATGDITPVYRSVGVHQIFSPNSGLKNIIKDHQVTVDGAWQITVIDVNEKGTEAASATGLDIIKVSLPLNQVIFNAEHPFLFYIKCANEQIFAGTFTG